MLFCIILPVMWTNRQTMMIRYVTARSTAGERVPVRGISPKPKSRQTIIRESREQDRVLCQKIDVWIVFFSSVAHIFRRCKFCDSFVNFNGSCDSPTYYVQIGTAFDLLTCSCCTTVNTIVRYVRNCLATVVSTMWPFKSNKIAVFDFLITNYMLTRCETI